nr:MlaE family lipid ABC transporter permease subunit [Desulfobulbaceae bacterium]
MSSEPLFTLTDNRNNELTMAIEGELNTSNTARFTQLAEIEISSKRPSSLIVDLSDLKAIDDYGISSLACIKQKILSSGGNFYLTNVSDTIKELFKIHSFDKLTAPLASPSSSPDIFVKIGSSTLVSIKKFSFGMTFLGETIFSFFRLLASPKSFRTDDTIYNMRRVGVDALPIVALISFLLGLIMAFMSSVQLKQFGANIYVASLVGLSMTRELGPIMTAIIVSGRSSSAFAAEIGSMKISEEIDALFTMGIDPHQFLVLPRIIATVLMVPLLILFSDIFAILGGLIVGITMLGLTVDGYITQTINTLRLFDVFWGVFKGGIFALFISWIGCLRGFQVKEGAADVGKATTSAVVTSIFMVIVIDSIMVVILRYW